MIESLKYILRRKQSWIIMIICPHISFENSCKSLWWYRTRHDQYSAVLYKSKYIQLLHYTVISEWLAKINPGKKPPVKFLFQFACIFCSKHKGTVSFDALRQKCYHKNNIKCIGYRTQEYSRQLDHNIPQQWWNFLSLITYAFHVIQCLQWISCRNKVQVSVIV